MDMDTRTDNSSANDTSQAMDISEAIASNDKLCVVNRKIGKKSAPKRRGQTLRKAKAIEKALSNNEKTHEKIVKNQDKAQRANSIKSLY